MTALELREWLTSWKALMNKIWIRRVVMDDHLDMLEWRNHPSTRAMSLDSKIIDQNSHLIWFDRLMNSKAQAGYMASINNKKIGVVLFEKQQKCAVLSVYLDPTERGKGYAKEVLRLAIRHYCKSEIAIEKIKADVKHKNFASNKLFISLGFSLLLTKKRFKTYSLTVKDN